MSFRTSLRRTLQPIQSTLTASPSPRPSFIPFPLLRTTPSYRPQSTFSSSEKHDAEKAQAEAAEKKAAAGGADGVGAGSGAGKASGADVGGKGKSAAPGDEGMKKVKDLEDQVKELKVSQIENDLETSAISIRYISLRPGSDSPPPFPHCTIVPFNSLKSNTPEQTSSTSPVVLKPKNKPQKITPSNHSPLTSSPPSTFSISHSTTSLNPFLQHPKKIL